MDKAGLEKLKEHEPAIFKEHLERVHEETKVALPDMDLYLIAFNDGSYKKLRSTKWKHSQWIHFTMPDGSITRVNPANVNYMHQGVSE